MSETNQNQDSRNFSFWTFGNFSQETSETSFCPFFLCWLSSVQFGRQAAQAIFSPSDFALFQLVGWRRQTSQRARQKLQHDQPDALSGGLHSLRLSKDTGGTGTGRRPAKVGTSQTTGYPMTTPMLGFTPNYGQITNTFLRNKSPIKAPHLLGQIRSNCWVTPQ